MGNYRWIGRCLRRARGKGISEWIEAGAGDGALARCFSPSERESFPVTGFDLVPRPAEWPEQWSWRQGDVFEQLGEEDREKGSLGLVAILFLHHFEDDALGKLGDVIERECSCVLFSEPARYRFFSLAAIGFYPFINAVTRHDMRVSIGAGFRKGELPEALRLGEEWEIRESVTIFGAYRMEAWRRKDRESRS